nr:hypothetical protein SA21230_2184 [Staphylococcus aureus subsp. aureus 21230]
MLDKISNTLKKKLYQKGETHSGNDNLIIQGYLIAQIEKIILKKHWLQNP